MDVNNSPTGESPWNLKRWQWDEFRIPTKPFFWEYAFKEEDPLEVIETKLDYVEGVSYVGTIQLIAMVLLAFMVGMLVRNEK